MAKSVSQNELEVIQLLIEHSSCSVAELMGHLNVTATAIRQRISRLLAAGMIDRRTESEGRGRPTHRYWLTDAGRRLSGNNLAEVAGALWHEIQRVADDSVRQSIINGVVDRLAATYASKISGKTLDERLSSIAGLFRERDIPVAVEHQNGTPTLKILACPYPDLENDNHEVCDMEKRLFSQVVGGPVDLCQCHKDGDNCCSFQNATTPKQLNTTSHLPNSSNTL